MAWEQPRTTKLYLHPPLSQRQITLWPDLKIVNKRVAPDEAHPADDHGIRLLLGPDAEPADWLLSRFRIDPSGAPLPAIEARWDEFELCIEAFCSNDANPATHLRLQVTNPRIQPRDLALGIMARTGLDKFLLGICGDYYASYRPQLAQWGMIRNTWHLEGETLSDGLHRVSIEAPENVSPQWVACNPRNPWARSYAELTLHLDSHETQEITLTLSTDGVTPAAGDWGQARQRASQAWQKRLGAMHTLPDTQDATVQTAFRSLVAQCLQMLAQDPNGRIWPRQGGRHDGVWPVETVEWLMALDRVGLAEWAEVGYRFFRNRQVMPGDPSGEEGRILGLAASRWTSETGGVLMGLAYHLMQCDDPDLLQAYRPMLLRGLAWIGGQREQTRDQDDPLGRGLMPAGAGHDWQYKGQYWCLTDGWSYMGVRAAADMLAHFCDPEAERVAHDADDYEACLTRTLEALYAGHEQDAAFFVPNVLGVPETFPPFGPYQTDGPVHLIRAGIIPAKSHLFEQIEAYFRVQGWMARGLTGHMTESLFRDGYSADPWAGHTWYISFSDLPFFTAWLERGERDKARETLDAQFRYGMSSEFYALERYADNDPTFCPWQPNASGNGRTLMMLLDYYGEAHR